MSVKKAPLPKCKEKIEEFAPLQTIKKTLKTRIIVRFDAGYPNNLYIRGSGAGLNWERGTPLKNLKKDEWIFETHEIFSICHYKILINDQYYELGENHQIRCGLTIQHTPNF